MGHGGAVESRSSDDAQLLRTYLAGRSAACPACTYDLRNLTGDRCPECGEVLLLRLTLEEPRQGAFITGLVALAASTGFSGLLLVYFCVRYMMSAGVGRIEEFGIVTSGGLVISSLMLAAWVLARRKLRRLRFAFRWAWAGACFLVPITNLSVFTLTIR